MADDAKPYVDAIRASGRSIYDPIAVGDPTYWIPTPILEGLLHESLKGVSLAGLPIRTRSKVVKSAICEALGYPVPRSFTKTQPRFPGQGFDTYTQKSNNLQIFNEELAGSRRYVLIRVSEDDVVIRVKVVNGDTLARLDTTGTLTHKYQASCVPRAEPLELISPNDTERLAPLTRPELDLRTLGSPISPPRPGELLSIGAIFERLAPLVGQAFPNAGAIQERNRGAALHRLVCGALGYSSYQDDGQFPDVRHQLLEIKLQTSPTVDLGLVHPNSDEPLDVAMLNGTQVRHCDVRYALFYGRLDGSDVRLTHLFLTTGRDFFTRFPQFQGRVLNSKLQIPLPRGFFDG